jgi:ribosomal protein S18 acetylase RimI-like enzyme
MIRILRASEIEGIVPLLRAAYRRDAPYGARLTRYVGIQPDGWFVAEEDGERVGVVGVVVHETAAYVGLMAVHPSHQRRGLARRLLDRALAFVRERGVPLVMLDASDSGAPLYERYGFADRGLTHDLVYEGGPRDTVVDGASVDEVLALDREQFGANRAPTLRAFAASYPARLLVVREGGAVVAYAIAQSAVIGPIVSKTPQAARALLRAATSLPFDAPPHVFAPEEHGSLLASEGFRVTRSLRHMRLGGPEIRYGVIGKASLAVG